MAKRNAFESGPSPLAALARPLKGAIAAKVVGLFNDASADERPVARRSDALLGPKTVAWRVHGDVTSMMVGGIASLMLQMLHPAVLAGVWDHSNFRTDMLGRLRRTARFIALTTYGERSEGEKAIEHVREIHTRVKGILPDGRPYAADDPSLLAWVHLTETTSFLDAWMRYAEPGMPIADQDRYFAEMATIGCALGAKPVPKSRPEAHRLIDAMRSELLYDARTREMARLVLAPPTADLMAVPLQKITIEAAIDLLPAWARRMHGVRNYGPGRVLIRAGTYGVARTLRWALD